MTDSVNLEARPEGPFLITRPYPSRLVRIPLTTTLCSGWSLNKPSTRRMPTLMVYCSVFLYRVPRRKAEAFVQALRPIMKLFLDSGALSDELLRPKDMTAKFGGASLPSAVELANDEELWIEIAKFKDASHMKDVHSR